MPALPPALWTVLLLVASNIFMTFAWYGHLKFKSAPLAVAILASWGIAFFEYLLQVPANRIGYGQLSAAQLKVIQEVVTLSVFVIFAWAWLGEAPTWRHLLGFALIGCGAALIFLGPGARP
ncbi:DMT family protein [Frigidibacter sp. MR17.24]|uniref:DMT family protein n=1 Tax=Frigidibacter sp. MR17.24 TaxID=3127345 RepID=UPI003012D817